MPAKVSHVLMPACCEGIARTRAHNSAEYNAERHITLRSILPKGHITLRRIVLRGHITLRSTVLRGVFENLALTALNDGTSHTVG